MPGMRMSSTRHPGRSSRPASRKSCADSNTSTGSPTDLSSSRSESRTAASSSTTNTVGFCSFITRHSPVLTAGDTGSVK